MISRRKILAAGLAVTAGCRRERGDGFNGYAFVAKGTQAAHLHHLQHESLVYSRLERPQGEVAPVCLEIVDLGRSYFLPGGARVVHMLLMSWGGEFAAVGGGCAGPEGGVKRSSQAVYTEGVIHSDEREPNILWNEERGRVMLIDFDQAILLPVPKSEDLSKLLSKKTKRKDNHEVYRRKRLMVDNSLEAETSV